jgi:hypothetical protein
MLTAPLTSDQAYYTTARDDAGLVDARYMRHAGQEEWL